MYLCVYLCVCVCERERERERGAVREIEGIVNIQDTGVYISASQTYSGLEELT